MKNLFKSNKTNTNTTNSKGVKTMKKTSIFKKIIAGVLSAITVFSVGTVALTSASAAETGVVESVKYKGNTIYYSDDYFRHSSTEYDEHLATLSCIMTNFSVPLDNPSGTSNSRKDYMDSSVLSASRISRPTKIMYPDHALIRSA